MHDSLTYQSSVMVRYASLTHWRDWEKHLPDKMPKAKDVLVEELAKVDDVCGRDIKNAVIDAAMRAARKGKTLIELTDLLRAIKGIKKSRINIYSDDSSEELTPQEKNLIGEKIKAAIEIEKEERIEKNET